MNMFQRSGSFVTLYFNQLTIFKSVIKNINELFLKL